MKRNWITSSKSSGNGNCVQVAKRPGGGVVVRNSKKPNGARVPFTEAEWKAFLVGVKADEFGFDF